MRMGWRKRRRRKTGGKTEIVKETGEMIQRAREK